MTFDRFCSFREVIVIHREIIMGSSSVVCFFKASKIALIVSGCRIVLCFLTDEARDTTCVTHLTVPLPVNPHQEQEGKRDFTKSHLHGCLTAHQQQDFAKSMQEHNMQASCYLQWMKTGIVSPGFGLVAPPSLARQRGRAPNRELAERLFSAAL